MTSPVTPAWLARIKQFEGFRSTAYVDAAGVWTIGYGSTRHVKQGDTITEPQAERRMIADLEACAGSVENLTHTVDLTDGQRDALIDFAYNLGANALAKSTLLKCVLAGDHDGAAKQFGKWVFAGGKKLPGLVQRRAREAERYLAESPAHGPPRVAPARSARAEADDSPSSGERSTLSPPADRSGHSRPDANGLQQSANSAGASGSAGTGAPATFRQPDVEPVAADETVRPWWVSKRLKAGATLAAGSQVPGWIDTLWEKASEWFANDPDAVNTLWSHAVTLLAVKWVGYAIFAGGAAWLAWTFFYDRKQKG